MALSYQEVREFVRDRGDVTAYTSSGHATVLRDGEPEFAGMVEMWADIFEFGGQRYTRAQFERLVHGSKG